MLFVPHVNEYVATMREINKRAFKTELKGQTYENFEKNEETPYDQFHDGPYKR